MATVTTLKSAAKGYKTRGAKPYFISNEVDMAAAVTAKGTALASSDVIEAVTIPANTHVLSVAMKVTGAHAGTSSDTAFDLGVTGVDADLFVDGFDFDGASLNDYAVATGNTYYTEASDTVDILIQAMTGTTTGGKLTVKALLMEGDNEVTAADEVDRDTLA